MLIRYTKPGGKEVDLPDAAARRLIAAGAAEEVKQPGATARNVAASEETAARAPAKTTGRTK